MQPADELSLFDSVFLAKLEQLYLLAKRRFRGDQHAERSSRQIGSSLEFADYRTYSLGDDLRSVDWNIYGRLDRLFVKLFELEQDLHIHFLVDASASMRWLPEGAGTRKGRVADRQAGARSVTKFDQARRIAASLAYIGLSNLDRVDIHWFADGLSGNMGLARGKSQFHKVVDFLRRAPESAGPTRLLPSLRAFSKMTRRRGLVFVLSDLFDPCGYEEALALLHHHQFEIHLIQVFAPEELDPSVSGDLRLMEPETGEALEITAGDAVLHQYRKEIAAFYDGVSRFAMERGFGYLKASTALPFEDLVLRVLREGIMLK